MKILSVVLCAVGLSAACLAANGGLPPAEVTQAGREGVTRFIKSGLPGLLDNFGFKTQAEIDRAELAEGFPVCGIDPHKLLDERSPQDLPTLVQVGTEWRFLIRTSGRIATLLTVASDHGTWTAVGIGGSGLATELGGVLTVWPASAGYRYRWLRVREASSDFIELSQGGKVLGLIPLTFYGADRGGHTAGVDAPGDLHDSKEVLAKLRPLVRSALSRATVP